MVWQRQRQILSSLSTAVSDYTSNMYVALIGYDVGGKKRGS